MSVTVSDTSPVRCLAHLELLDLFESLFGEVLLPPAVANELERPTRGFGPIIVSAHSFLRVKAATNVRQVTRLHSFLDPGESEAIALAKQFDADRLIVDDALARAEAVRMGIATVGTAGVLLHAKRTRMITSVIPLLDRLEAELRFFVSSELRREVCRRAGE